MAVNEKKYVHLSNARVPEQLEVMKKIVEDNVCPFCAENLEKYHTEPILLTGHHWFITRNRWPYKETKNHFIAIATTHVENFDELSPDAGKELIELFQKICTEFGIGGGGFAMRFGDQVFLANSVRHLHAHLIQPDVENPDHEGVKFPISKSRRKSD